MSPNFLIVGGGGRESAFALRLAEDSTVSAFVTHENPTIVDCVQRSGGRMRTGNVQDPGAVTRFARECAVDYAFVSADGPLAAGVVDALLAAGIKTVGATRAAARIEWDKVHAIRTMQAVAPDFTPKCEVIEEPAQLAAALLRFENQGMEVVVKPQGLTGGKGVKVMPGHLPDYPACEDYARQLLAARPDERVLLVEKLNGIEFTIMGLTDGIELVLSPATYDYPFRFENDTGPGTGGMGCFTGAKKNLPFLSDADIRDCETIMRRVVDRLAADGNRFNGVLNGGFFKTAEGIRFMEFNARFGDPEGLNVLMVLEGSFAELLRALWDGSLSSQKVGFLPEASVAKYLVAKEYPDASPTMTEFQMDETAIRNEGASLFFGACEEVGVGRYRTMGSSRVLALGATAPTIVEASERINQLIARHITESLDYRSDIGTQADVDQLVRRAAAWKDAVRTP